MENEPGKIEKALLDNIDRSKALGNEQQVQTAQTFLDNLKEYIDSDEFIDFPADRLQDGNKTYVLHEIPILLGTHIELEKYGLKHDLTIEQQIHKAIRMYLIGEQLLENKENS